MLILKSENSWVWKWSEIPAKERMPYTLKPAHNIWEIDVTWETLMSCLHVCVCDSLSNAFSGEMNWLRRNMAFEISYYFYLDDLYKLWAFVVFENS